MNNNNDNSSGKERVVYPISFDAAREVVELDVKIQEKWKRLLEKFLKDPDRTVFESPHGLSPDDRKFLHLLAEEKNLKSESRARNRTVFIFKEKRQNDANQISSSLYKKWKDDFGLRISMVCAEDFDYFLELYDPYYQTKDKLALLKQALTFAGTEDRFGNYYDNLKVAVKEHIEKKEEFQKFLEDSMNSYTAHPSVLRFFKSCKTNVYLPENDHKEFVSLDLKSSNFTCMKFYNAALFDGFTKWEDFLGQFTTCDYFLKNKLFRQKIFWLLEPKKIRNINELLISVTAQILSDSLGIVPQYINNDEAIYSIPTENNSRAFALSVFETLRKASVQAVGKQFPQSAIRVEIFRLHRMSTKHSYFAKEVFWSEGQDLPAPSVSFPNVAADHFAIVFKSFYGMKIDPRDLKLLWNQQEGNWDLVSLDKLALLPLDKN